MNIYFCEICKRICYTYPVDSTLVCCNQEMVLLKPKKSEEGNEKHLPVVSKISDTSFNGFSLKMATNIILKHSNRKNNHMQNFMSIFLKQ